MNAKNKKQASGEDRRRARRTVVQESFHLFLVIPPIHGMVRIYMRDISRLGLCFRLEMECDIRSGQKFQARLYINPAFYLPLECVVVRAQPDEVAVEFLEPDSPAAQAVGKLQDFFESAESAGILVE
jgi:hypothetical protein